MKNFASDARLYVGSVLIAGTALVVAFASESILARGRFVMTIAAAAPIYLAYRTYKLLIERSLDQQLRVQQISDLHLATIEALALAIDAKDEIGQRHIRRMQVYAAQIASALGMRDSEIEGVKTAALLHDIGKLAVPEHILSKPGPLTQEEFQKIRVHPQVGAEIIGRVPFPYPVAPLILSHHERWDGNGYPAGLSGEAIPLGARILTLLDYFEALTSDRPYQRAMSIDAALHVLEQESGRALDPRVVRAFLRLYPTLAADPDATEQPFALRPASPLATPTESMPDLTVQPRVFRDIALAHREIYALYEIAQAMGSSLDLADTMALVSSKLTSLVPFSCCALFLRSGGTPTLQCRFAVGTEADVIRHLSMREGQGLAGWVARNRRPLVNASPRADLDAGGMAASPTSLESALVCPLVFNDLVIGTLSVYHAAPGFYTEDHRRLLDRISEQAAAVIHHSIIFEQTQQASLTDSLTGLANTRSMITHLTRELARAHRVDSEVSLILIDLDGFKEINDTYGHHTGDRALREVATALQATIRPYDMCIRYAGDEFIVVLSSCGREEAERKRLDLQHAIDQLRFEPQPGTIARLAISAGAAVFPHDGNSYELLLATADARMYRDKTHRKPRLTLLSDESVCNHTDPIPVSEVNVSRAANGVV
ncbi:MAG: hypothetical protein C5B57_11750 [Blastocatellia bacterium]|nr:MAG: hypothetical protein C5B57_11750 [Blastocatellia bacterium]